MARPGTKPPVPPPLSEADLAVPDRRGDPPRSPTPAGHLSFEVGGNLTPRFKIMRKFGEGTFGQVLECWDRRRGDYVAVKAVRRVPKYRDAAMGELRVLAALGTADPSGTAHCVRLLDWFDYHGHVCMVFERAGPSLFDFLRRNGYAPLPLPLVRAALKQLLEALAFLHGLGIVHTDVKPENVLAAGTATSRGTWPPGSKLARRLPASSELKLIDFGSAVWTAEPHAHVVSTRHYRAPEVVLGAGWSHPADLWSLGCVAVELLTGDALFPTHENSEHLALMQAALGVIPRDLAAAATIPEVKALFTDGVLDWPGVASSRKSAKVVSRAKPLETLLEELGDASIVPHLPVIVDLIKRMLEFRPADRPTAAALLRHPFFSLEI